MRMPASISRWTSRQANAVHSGNFWYGGKQTFCDGLLPTEKDDDWFSPWQFHVCSHLAPWLCECSAHHVRKGKKSGNELRNYLDFNLFGTESNSQPSHLMILPILLATLVYTPRDFSISIFSAMRRGRPIALTLFAFVVTLRTGRWLSFAPCQPCECLQSL